MHVHWLVQEFKNDDQPQARSAEAQSKRKDGKGGRSMDRRREEQLLQEIGRLRQELDRTHGLLNERIGAALPCTSELAGKDKDSNDALLEIQGLSTIAPYTNVEFSSNLSDYAEDERYGDAFERAKLCRLLELSPKDRKKVSIAAYLFAGGHCPGINKTQFRILTSTRHPIDPKLLLHLISEMNDDIDAGRPMMVASRISLPQDVSDCVRNQVLSTHEAAARICYKAVEKDGSKKPNPKRKQFKCDEKDATFILFASLDPTITESTIKRQVSAVRTMGLLDNRLPAIEEENDGEREVELANGTAERQALDKTAAASALEDRAEDADDDGGDILDDDETFAASFDDWSTHAGDSTCIARPRANNGDASSVASSTLREEQFVDDHSAGPLNREIIFGDHSDDVSTITARRASHCQTSPNIDEVFGEDLSATVKAKAEEALEAVKDGMPEEEMDQFNHIYRVFRHHLLDLSDEEIQCRAAQCMNLMSLVR